MFNHVSAGFGGVLEGFGSCQSQVSFTEVQKRFKVFRFVPGDIFWGPPRLSGEILRGFRGTSDAFQCISDVTEGLRGVSVCFTNSEVSPMGVSGDVLEKSLETLVPMGVFEAFQGVSACFNRVQRGFGGFGSSEVSITGVPKATQGVSMRFRTFPEDFKETLGGFLTLR